MTKPSSARPPVPSAAESSQSSVVLPIVAYVIFMVFGGTLIHTAGWPFICISCIGLVVLGFVSSIWGFYVAAFYGPRKHISTAIVGFTLNVVVIVVPIVLTICAHNNDDDNDGAQYEARSSHSATQHSRH